MLPLVLPLLSLFSVVRAQVTATFPNGPTNPEAPSFAAVGSTVNQTSYARLLTLNGVDDFCLFGPPETGPDQLIGNVEPIVVAYCTKPRNNARLIPDGAITAAHFIKTPTYVQIYGFYDGTKLGIPNGDAGGELDPHGAEGTGNPIGGNVTSNVEGKDVFYEEWMSFISYDQFCMRVCTGGNDTVPAALQCEHELDIMGCAFVMAIPDFYSQNNSFTSCEGEVAPPPGLYPQAAGGYSTFRQRFTGTWGGEVHTIGNEVTPNAPAYYPKTSNCFTYSTISNGVNTQDFKVLAAPTTLSGSETVPASGVSTTSMSGGPTTGTSQSASGAGRGAASAASAGGSGASAVSGAAADAATTSGAAMPRAMSMRKDVGLAYRLVIPALMFGAAILI